MEQHGQPPGYRFKPTDDELVSYYLRPKALGRTYFQGTIADVDVYKYEPWDLPGKSALPTKDQEWYFFSVQDRKYSRTARINRTTKKGYWKATGKDRKIYNVSDAIIGSKKSLVYYDGRAPKGRRTNWIMHEYRLDEELEKRETIVCAAVLCRIREKRGPGPRNGEQYGAPVSNESEELEEEVDIGKVDDSSERGTWEVESKCGGNAYNLQDQAEGWKMPAGQMGSPKVLLTHYDTVQIASDSTNLPDKAETLACDPAMKAVFQSIVDTACYDMAPYIYEHDRDPFMDLQNTSLLFDADNLLVLPSSSDVDIRLHDYKFPDFDEYDMLREMADHVKDGQGDVLPGTGLQENVTIQAHCNVPLGGDYIELDDMKDPLCGYAPWAPMESSELGNVEGMRLSETMPGLFEEMQDVLHSQGLAAHRDRLQSPGVSGRLKAATVTPQVEIGSHGGRFTSSREVHRNAGGKNNSDSAFGEYDPSHLVQSSTRSYLSKHVATYAVSKHEMVPAQLCYASSFTDKQHHGSATALTIESECDIAVDAVRILPAKPMDISLLPSLLINTSSSIDRDASETLPPALMSSLSGLPSSSNGSSPDVEAPTSSSGLPSSSNGSSLDVEAPLATQLCESQAESASMNSTHRHRWKRPLRGLVSKVKGSAFGTRIAELENGMRVKLNDKLLALGKSAVRVVIVPTERHASAYDNLRKWIVATLCRLVAAVLIFFCSLWGSHILVSYAFGVSV